MFASGVLLLFLSDQYPQYKTWVVEDVTYTIPVEEEYRYVLFSLSRISLTLHGSPPYRPLEIREVSVSVPAEGGGEGTEGETPATQKQVKKIIGGKKKKVSKGTRVPKLLSLRENSTLMSLSDDSPFVYPCVPPPCPVFPLSFLAVSPSL